MAAANNKLRLCLHTNHTQQQQPRRKTTHLLTKKLLFVFISILFVLNNNGSYFFRGKPQTPKNQTPSPRGYRLTTYSPEAELAVPGGVRIASVDAVRDLHVEGTVDPRATAPAGADGIRAGPCSGVGVTAAV
jgi:hypothetical protein